MFKNFVILVTGAASGLGKGTAELFINKGAKVVLCDLKTSNGEAVAKELGENATFIPVDVRSDEDIKTAIKLTKEKHNKLNVLVNCASVSCAHEVMSPRASLLFNIDTFRNVLHTNVSGTFNVMSRAVGLMAENQPNEEGQRGVIINTSAYVAYEGDVGQSAIAASSASIQGITLPLARDFKQFGIRVNSIAPGLTESPVFREIPPPTLEILSDKVTFPRRFGKPEEFAKLVQSIVLNPYINATTIRLDGGLRLKQ